MTPQTLAVLRRKAEADPRYQRLLDRSPAPVAGVASAPPGPPPRREPGKVNVGFLVPVDKLIGGAERVCHDLIRALDPARFRHAGTALRPDPPATVHALARAADVLVVWGIRDWPVMLPEGRRPAVVLVAHGSNGWAADSVAEAAKADALVAVGPSCVAPFPEAERPRVKVIANMVDPARVRAGRPRADVRRQWGVPEDATVALCLARLSAEKRPHVALGAASEPDGVFVVLHGQGALRDELAALAAATPGARLFPPTEDVGSALHAADCLVLPSETEGCSLAGLEAHAAGLPVIATPVGLYADRPGLARLVPPLCSSDDLRRAILDDREDWHGTKARAEDARLYAAEVHGPEDFKAEWEAVIASVAPPPPPPGPGAVLMRWLAWGWWKSSGGCGCADFAAKMDDWGPDGCEAHMDEIVAHLMAAARREGVPLVRPSAVRILAKRAIRVSREGGA